MSRFVVDANVAIQWSLPEIHSDAALRLLAQQHTLYAPDLIFQSSATFSVSGLGKTRSLNISQCQTRWFANSASPSGSRCSCSIPQLVQALPMTSLQMLAEVCLCL